KSLGFVDKVLLAGILFFVTENVWSGSKRQVEPRVADDAANGIGHRTLCDALDAVQKVAFLSAPDQHVARPYLDVLLGQAILFVAKHAGVAERYRHNRLAIVA